MMKLVNMEWKLLNYIKLVIVDTYNAMEWMRWHTRQRTRPKMNPDTCLSVAWSQV